MGVADRVQPKTGADVEIVCRQLGREPRGMYGVAWRCPCGKPGVVATAPRLPDGTPFPTVYYLTCPRATAAVGTLEANGYLAQMTARLADDEQLRQRYLAAHQAYLADRAEVAELAGVGEVNEVAGRSAGGMPVRVKCLHVLVAHSLAAGPGVNPFGDEAVELIGEFWADSCLAE